MGLLKRRSAAMSTRSSATNTWQAQVTALGQATVTASWALQSPPLLLASSQPRRQGEPNPQHLCVQSCAWKGRAESAVLSELFYRYSFDYCAGATAPSSG